MRQFEVQDQGNGNFPVICHHPELWLPHCQEDQRPTTKKPPRTRARLKTLISAQISLSGFYARARGSRGTFAPFWTALEPEKSGGQFFG